MYLKWVGIGLMLFGSYVIYVKRHYDDDSLLLGTGLLLTGILVITVGWIVILDSKRK